MAVIEASNIWKRYTPTDDPVLRGVSLRVESGEFVAIAGSSGSGKSTLLSILGCLDFPTDGDFLLDGIEIKKLSDRDLTRVRAERIGFVFQRFNLIPTATALENVEYPMVVLKLGARERKRRALDALEQVGLKDFTGRFPLDLSGGQQQRVAIARAIVKSPSIIFADEPTASLDHHNAELVLQLIQTLNRENKTTFVFSSHDPAVLNFAERRLFLSSGIFVEEGRQHVA
ncbi:MAG: ABC transporter ATP-binding protein [Deltaproteobacteria bacterium]|nr:ABC transporter ATP-binding protein [Deltaproteobacteria bacterium]MBI3293977.1 ABC transporter ATP-binding protein [Deltaproteobacteria bacterium]